VRLLAYPPAPPSAAPAAAAAAVITTLTALRLRHHQEHLRPLLMSYNRDLGGVALCFRDVRLCGGGGSGGGGGLAKILYENPGIFVKVSVTLLLFAPCVGDVLVGRVNFVGHDHIGLTVHGLLKASISQSEFPPSYSLDDGATCWGDSSGGRNLDLCVDMAVGQKRREKEGRWVSC
jgi:hypothetical protein